MQQGPHEVVQAMNLPSMRRHSQLTPALGDPAPQTTPDCSWRVSVVPRASRDGYTHDGKKLLKQKLQN